MSSPPKTALAQINPTVGDLDGNALRIREYADRASSEGAELVLFPEMALTGYPAEDLYLRADFLAATRATLDRLAAAIEGPTCVVGFPEEVAAGGLGAVRAANSAAVISEGGIEAVYRKRTLPNYGVFDERRTFVPGESALTIEVGGISVGLTICEDGWVQSGAVWDDLAPGADLILNLSASPFNRGKREEREAIFRELAKSKGLPVAMTNLVGGQDELVFDGDSLAIDRGGGIVARGTQFSEDLVFVDWLDTGGVDPGLDDLEEVYGALVLGLSDYAEKNGFRRVALGLSGGIDSALVAVIASDALGPENVTCVVMPSPHSSGETQEDARRMATNLGCELLEFPIGDLMEDYGGLLGSDYHGLAAENVQARIRGNLLMALSNSRGSLVLSTSNKSETSVGYSTLYGDMAGGYAPLRDVTKGLVYELAEWRNRDDSPIPEGIIARPPTAELRPDQLDSDSLPPYSELDRIVALYVEGGIGPADLIAGGEDPQLVNRVVAMVDRAEYKRRQAPPGPRISTRAFGRDRRVPITNRFVPDQPG